MPLETRQKIMAGDSSRFGTYTTIQDVAAEAVLTEVELDFQQFEECKLNFSRQAKYWRALGNLLGLKTLSWAFAQEFLLKSDRGTGRTKDWLAPGQAQILQAHLETLSPGQYYPIYILSRRLYRFLPHLGDGSSWW